MIEIRKLKYMVYLLLENKEYLDITGATEGMNWSENKKELAMRINLTLANAKYKGKPLSNLAKPGCMIFVYVLNEGIKTEIIRGTIVNWETNSSSSRENLKLTCYDNLYNLQESQDYIYYSKGVSTKSAITGILDKWKVKLEKYDGPLHTHGKLVYKSETLCNAILDILDDAEKKGAEKYYLRSEKGKISVVKRGSNKDVYLFECGNVISTSFQQSTDGMVTRVKILSKESGEKKQSVVTTVDGKTQYGIRQKIYSSKKDESVEDAKKEANKILDEKGKLQKSIEVETPDIPFLRKGDMVCISIRNLSAFYYIEGIRHDADNATMSMDLKYAKPYENEKEKSKGTVKQKDTAYKKGDVVILNGAIYRDSFGKGKGKTFKDYIGKITITADASRECPYHIDGIGWVHKTDIKRK